MFGGIHIEKLLYETHVQLIASSRLPWFLNYPKLSITGTGKIALNALI